MNPRKIIQPVSLSRADIPTPMSPQQPDAQSVQGMGIQPRFDVSKVYADIEQASLDTTPVPDKPRRRLNFGKARNIIFVLLLILVVAAFFTRNEYRHITTIEPAALTAPLQTPTTATEFIYEHKGVEYSVKPLFEYELNGMVVSRLDYEKTSTADERADNTLVPTDLCMLWGENLSSGVYKSRSTTFSQGGRWCRWKWGDGAGIVNEAVANNHLLFTDPSVKAKLKNIQAGDQIKIIGKLVDIRTVTQGVSPEKIVSRHSSTVRTDTGDSSCEDILVEDIVILRENRNVSQIILKGGLIALGLLVGLSLILGLLRRHSKASSP